MAHEVVAHVVCYSTNTLAASLINDSLPLEDGHDGHEPLLPELLIDITTSTTTTTISRLPLR